jgi:hypothetical protein
MAFRTSLSARCAVAALALCALIPATAVAAPRPEDSRLAAAVDRYSAALGVHRSSTSAVAQAALPTAVADKLTNELNQLYACDSITRSNVDNVVNAFRAGLPDGQPPVFPFTPQRAGDTTLGAPTPSLPNPELPQHFPFEGAVRACGEASVSKLETLRAELAGRTLSTSSGLDLWPVLRFAPGTGGHTYDHDYVLLVELGGNNRYFNNAGGSGIDIWRGPAGSGAEINAPARGCIDAFDIIRRQTCTLSSAALLSMKGGNQYGRLEAPDPATDGYCTNDPVGRRVFTQGSGVVGVGAIIDAGGNNTYIGKVLTTGVGHIGGYGYLRADGDNNSYKVIRFGIGASVVGGIGTLVATGSGNTYSYYTPSAKDPSAKPGFAGSGGVVNDLNGCDNGTSITLGAGSVGGVGVLQASGRTNSYTAPRSSLGTGIVGGKGTFESIGGGPDTYTGPGAVGRADNTTINPTSTNNGTFVDR